jgi:hypothetical protein
VRSLCLTSLPRRLRSALDAFDKKPLVIGPTTYTSKLHIQTTRPMAILAATNGKSNTWPITGVGGCQTCPRMPTDCPRIASRAILNEQHRKAYLAERHGDEKAAKQ